METTDARMFEGLFVRGLGVSPSSQFGADLRRVGFDLEDPREDYDTTVWTRCLNVARRLMYPGQPCELAWRALGGVLISNRFWTPGASVLDCAARSMPVGSFVERLPSLLHSEIGSRALAVVELGSGSATLALHEPHSAASVLLGVLDGCLWRLGARCEFTGVNFVEGSLVDIRWGPHRSVGAEAVAGAPHRVG